MTVRLRLVSIALVMLAMVPVAAAAQSTTTVGVKAGVTMANISADNTETKNKLGLVGGLFMVRQINDGLGLQVEALVSQQGAEDDAPGSDIKFKVNYFNVPVLARFGKTTTDATHFHVFTGPQAGFVLSSKASSEALGLSVDLDDEIKSFDLSWVAGVAVEMNRLTFDARYAFGLNNIAKTAGDSGKNRVLSATVGIRLK